MNGITAPLVGNLTADPEGGTTQTGKQWCRFTVATNARHRNADGEFQDQEPVFWKCEAWNAAARATQELRAGDPVIVVGEIRSQAWTTDAGDPRRRVFVAVEAAGRNAVLAQPRQPAPPDADQADWDNQR